MPIRQTLMRPCRHHGQYFNSKRPNPCFYCLRKAAIDAYVSNPAFKPEERLLASIFGEGRFLEKRGVSSNPAPKKPYPIYSPAGRAHFARR